MAEEVTATKQISTKTYQILLLLGGGLVIGWSFLWPWMAPELNHARNEFLIIGGTLIAFSGLTFVSNFFRKRAYNLIVIAIWAICAHGFYFCYINQFDTNTVLGVFISFAAVCLCFATLRSYVIFCVATLAACIVLPMYSGTKTNPFLITIGLNTFQIVGFWMIMSRKSYIKSLRSKARNFSALVSAMPSGVIIFEDGKISRVNSALIKLAGTDDVKYVDTIEELLIAMELEGGTKLRQILNAKQQNCSEEITLTSKDGSKALSFKRLPYKQQGQDVRLICVDDVTQDEDLRNRINEVAAYLTTAERVLESSKNEIKVANEGIKQSLSIMKKGASTADKNARLNALKSIVTFSRTIDEEVNNIDEYFTGAHSESA